MGTINDYENVFDYILQEESRFKVDRVPVGEGWDWNFAEHIKRSMLMKNSRYEGGNLGDKPFKNIVRPILNVQYRTEGFDVKDVEPFVNSSKDFYKSFLVRKYYRPFAIKHKLDTYIDDTVESYVDYGIAISKRVNNVAPENVPLQRIAFCDQTNVEGGPICEKHAYGIDQLVDMKGTWYSDKIDELLIMAKPEKPNDSAGTQKAKTPGKYIEVYELHGVLPSTWLNDGAGNPYDGSYKRQMQIVAFYKNKEGKKCGITLFKGPEKKSIYKVLVRDKIYGRCAGFGGVEELFEPQLWINYNEIQLKEMRDAASVIIMQTADKAFAKRNPTISSMKNGKVLYTEEGKPLNQVAMTPNTALFDRATEEWKLLAKTTGSANDPVLGQSPSAGTPFKLQETVINENYGLHEWRQGKIAEYVAEVHRDWVLDSLVQEMNNGQEFIDNLTADELNEIADNVVGNEIEKRKKQIIFSNKKVTPQEIEVMRETERARFLKGGSKRFLKALKDELKDIPVDVEINIKGKQKDLSRMTDKLVNIFRDIISNPQILKIPAFAKLFNEIIEYSGLSAMDFTSFTKETLSGGSEDQGGQQGQNGQGAPAATGGVPANPLANLTTAGATA